MTWATGAALDVPTQGWVALFDLPEHPTGTSVSGVAAFPGAVAPGGVLVRAERRGPVESLPLFGG